MLGVGVKDGVIDNDEVIDTVGVKDGVAGNDDVTDGVGVNVGVTVGVTEIEAPKDGDGETSVLAANIPILAIPKGINNIYKKVLINQLKTF